MIAVSGVAVTVVEIVEIATTAVACDKGDCVVVVAVVVVGDVDLGFSVLVERAKQQGVAWCAYVVE